MPRLIAIVGRCVDPDGVDLGSKGSGKSTVVNILCEGAGVRALAFADPLKKIAQQLYDFTDEQLWGESQLRDMPDKRYPKPDGSFLTPREVLQTLGEWGRSCWIDTWVTRWQKDAALATGTHVVPGRHDGLRAFRLDQVHTIVVSDIRHRNELEAIQAGGGQLWLVRRTIESVDDMSGHVSETELADVDESMFDVVINNDARLEDLEQKVREYQ